MDGEVSLKVSLDTKSFEKQIERTELELKKMEKQYEFLTKMNEKRANSQEKTYTLTAKEYEMAHKLGLTMDDIGSKNTYTKLEQSIEKSRNKLIDLNKKQDELNNKDNSNAINSLKNIGNATENIIKKVAKWGLAIFSVRSAYMFVRQAVSTLSQYNEKIGTDIQYIRFALASSLQPLIEGIIKLVYKLLAYINYIAKAWFGVNLFANASAKAFKKVNSGIKDTNKSAKQLSKTLLGFDEMNILQKDGTTSVGGGGGGIASPSMNLSNLENIEIPGWVKWIADNKDIILKTLAEIGIMIGTAFAIKKILEFTNGVSKLSGSLEGMSGLKIFGIIAGLATTIWGIIETVEALTDDNVHLEKVLNGVSDMIIGIGIITAAFTPWGWVEVGIGLLGKLVSAFIDTRTDAEKLEEANRNLEDAQRAVNDAYQEYVNASKTHLNAYKNVEKAQKDLKDVAKKLGITTDELTKRGQDLYEEIREHPEKISELSDEDKRLYEAYLNVIDAEARLKTSEDKLKETEEKLTEAQKNEITKQLDKQKVLADTSGKYEEYRDAIINAYEQGALSGEEATGRISEALAKTDKESKQTFVDGIPGYIQDMMNTVQKSMGGIGTEWRTTTDDMKIYTDSLAGKFNSKFGKDIPNSVQKSVDKVKAFTKVLEKLPFGKTLSIAIQNKLGSTGMKTGGILKLASGAVINNPGRGVPLRSDVRGGEAGREGIIPLTDQQAMSQLGYEIGRNVVVAPTIPVYVGTRLVAKETRKINAEEQFAFNG